MEQERMDYRVKAVLRPEETAIIVIDVMEGYCNPDLPLLRFIRSSARALDEAADKMVAFLKASRRLPMAATIFVRMVERPETFPPSLRLKMEVDGIPPITEKDGVGWEYYKVRPEKGDHEIVKYVHDAFIGTDLDKQLKGSGVKTVIIVGGHASFCVDSTARTAAQLGYHTFVPADLTANPDSMGYPQTPTYIREQLVMINEVHGYMPLSTEILAALHDECLDP